MISSAVASVPMPAAVPAGFMPLADAAARTGRDQRTAERWANSLKPLGLAVNPGNRWYVSPDADARLLPYETREGRDLRQATELAKEGRSAKDIRKAEGTRDLIHRWGDCTLSGGTEESKARRFINQCLSDGTLVRLGIAKLSPRTLRLWEARYRAEGLRGLIRSAYPSRGETGFGEKALVMFLQVKRVPHGISVRAARDQVLGYIIQNRLEDDPAWALPAVRTVQIWWKENVHPAAKQLIDRGPHKMRATTIPKIKRDVLADYAAGELLVGDERTFDFMARQLGERGWYRVRLKLTAWRDAASGRIVGWYIGEHANSDTILASFKMACLAMGTVPREAYIDNGLDYKSVGGPPRRNRKWDHFDQKRLETAFERLGVKVHYAMPRAPWAKSIESTFAGDAGKGLDRFEAGFWGGTPAERAFDADRWTKANIMELPTVDEVRERYAAGLAAYRETPRRSLGTEGLTPNQVFERYFTARPRRVDADTLDLLCRKLVGPVRIGRDGVRYQRMRYGTFDEAVWRLQGREVFMLVDPIGRDGVILCQQDGTPICTANVDRPLGYKSEEIRERIAFQRRCEKAVKQYAPSRDYLLKTPAAQIAERRRLAAQARQIPDDALPPKPEPVSVELVRPDLAPAVEKLKRAAGAETLRRLHGVDAASRAVSRQGRRYVDFAELAAKGEPVVEDESEKVRRRSVDWAKMAEAQP
jgi:hypothetical protein